MLAVDLPGFGGTQAPPEAWKLDNYAHFLQALFGKLKLDQPYAVIGHSNGGALAIRAISLRVLRPQKLVLLAASGIRSSHTSKRLLLKTITKTGNAATIWLPERHRRTLRAKLYNQVGSDALVAPHLNETFRLIVRQDVQTDAAKITIPTLLLYAVNDQAVPVADGQRYHELIGQSKLEIISDAGHFIHLDQPAQTTKHIEEFLA